MSNHPSTGNYRYPGVTPFTTEQAPIFFGRKQATDDLYRLIRRKPLVVLYGKSGLGKSSLLNAGIIPLAQQDGTYQPLVVRFGSFTDRSVSPLERVVYALRGFVFGMEKGNVFGQTQADGSATAFGGLSAPSGILEKIKPNAEDSLWYHAKTRQLNGGGQPMLIFDQFEELFSYPQAAILEFQSELSELLNTGIPLRFRRLAETSGNLTEAQEEQLEAPLDARIVLAIRSDRLHLLDRLKALPQDAMESRFELLPLLPDDAQAAILLPAQAAGDFLTAPFTYTPAALQQLLAFLQDTQDGGRIEGILLQMLCEHYERQWVEAKGLATLDLPHIGDPQRVVEKYYEEKIDGLPPAQRLPARRLIEDGLVSEGEAMRLSLHERYILSEYGVDKQLLEQLVDSRLLRSEPFLRGGYTYELSHDRLVPPVLDARSLRREEEERLETQEREAERERQLVEAQRRAAQERTLREQAEMNEKRARQRTRLAAVVTVAALGLAVVAGWNYVQAERAGKRAEENAAFAEQKSKEAETALKDFLAEQAEKERLNFINLEARANIIIRAGGCPDALIKDMSHIAQIHPDSTNMRHTIQLLQSKTPCQ